MAPNKRYLVIISTSFFGVKTAKCYDGLVGDNESPPDMPELNVDLQDKVLYWRLNTGKSTLRGHQPLNTSGKMQDREIHYLDSKAEMLKVEKECMDTEMRSPRYHIRPH